MAQLYTAKEAAAALGRPALTRTLTRRADEAYQEGDERLQKIADRWAAPLPWWRERTQLRKPGRKPKPGANSRSLAPHEAASDPSRRVQPRETASRR